MNFNNYNILKLNVLYDNINKLSKSLNFKNTTIDDGLNIFYKNCIKSFIKNNDNDAVIKYELSILSEKNINDKYDVIILIDYKNNNYIDGECSCLSYLKYRCSIIYNEYRFCKHLIASLIQINNNIENETKIILDENDPMYKDFVCQICLNILIKPVIMPCFSHSICLNCTKGLFRTDKYIKCPSCRISTPVLYNKIQDLKINKELERIIYNYVDNKIILLTYPELITLSLINYAKGNNKLFNILISEYSLDFKETVLFLKFNEYKHFIKKIIN